MRISDWSSDVCSSDLANTIYWNGTAVDPATLKSYLRQTTQMDPEPELHLEPDPNARYALVDQVLAVAKQSQVTKMGFVGNERYYADCSWRSETAERREIGRATCRERGCTYG